MAIKISFKRGIKQSQQAALYFRGIVGGLVDAIVDDLQEHKYQIASLQGPSLQLKVWSGSSLQQEELHRLMELLMTFRAEIQGLQEAPNGDNDRIGRLVAGWLLDRMDGLDLYVELGIEFSEDGQRVEPEFTLALVHGRCAMISMDGLLFSWLEEDVFGLTLAGEGSYLVELVANDAIGGQRYLRQAS